MDKREFSLLDINISQQKTKIVRKDRNGGIKEEKVDRLNIEAQKLSDHQIVELAKICKKIKNHYKKPQDIEWVYEKGKFLSLNPG